MQPELWLLDGLKQLVGHDGKDYTRWCLSVSCNLCVVVTWCSALVRTSVFTRACLSSEPVCCICVARCDDTTE